MKYIFSKSIVLICLLFLGVKLSYGQNLQPTAFNDLSGTPPGVTATINVLNNDLDPNVGQVLTLNAVVVVSPSHGIVNAVNTVTGTISYTPIAGFCGVDSIKYKVCDNGVPVLCDSAWLIITVGGGASAVPTNVTVNGLTGNTITVCFGSDIPISATILPGYTAHWSGPSAFSSTQSLDTILNIGVNNSGSYCVYQVNSAIGCNSPSVCVNIAPHVCCPPNVDFEYGNFSYWKSFSGTIGGVVPVLTLTPGPATVPNQQLVPSGFPTPPVVNPSIVAPGNDMYGGFPVVCPNGGGNFSAKLGNDLSGNGAERLSYNIHIPVGSNNYNFIYNYAVVFEDPGHPLADQPKFAISVYDSATGLSIPCAAYDLVASASLPGFTQSTSTILTDVFYKSWSQFSIGLSGLGGHTMVIEFTTNDCNYGGHFGYAYIDISTACSVNAIVQGYCPGSVTAGLYGPPGYQSYVWYDSSLTTILGNNQAVTLLPAPTQPTWYALAVIPYPGFGCPDTIWTYLTAQPPPTAAFSLPSNYCAGSVAFFVDSSFSTTPGTYINHWQYNFGDPFATSLNPNIDSVTQNPTHVYNQMGTYTVCLIVKSNISCISDTVCKTIHINQPMPPLPMFQSKDTVCGPTDTVHINFAGIVKPNFTYTYVLDSCTNLINGSLNGPGSITVKYTCNGAHTIQFTAVPPLGDTTCWSTTTLHVFVKGQYPQMFVMGDDTICKNELDTISIMGQPSQCGPSVSGCAGGTSYITGSNNGAAVALPTPFRGFYTESKCQMLFTKAELNALGFQGGPISEVSWNVLVKSSSSPACSPNGQYADFTISMACVPYSSIYPGTTPVMDVTTPLTMVYTTPSYNTTLGINNFVLQTPYDWDGQSNLLVQTCFDAGSSCWTQDDQVAKSTNISLVNLYGLPVGSNLCVYANSDSYYGCDPLYGSGGNGFLPFTNVLDRPDVTFKACSGNVTPSTVFTWTSNPAGFASSAQDIIVSPLVTTTYTVVGNDGGCTTTKSFVVNQLSVNTLSAGNDTTYCGNANGVTLTATATGPIPPIPVPCGLSTSNNCSGPNIISTVVGNGNDLTTTITPFNNNYNNGRTQLRYKAAELQTALGSLPGQPYKISAIQFNITAKNSYLPHNGLSVSVGCFPVNAVLPSTFVGGLVPVYGPTNYTTVAGWNTLTFTTAYDWDGASDLLVDVCFGGATFSASDIVQKTVTAFNSVIWAGNPGGAAGCGMAAALPNVFGVATARPNAKFTGCPITVNFGSYNYFWTANPASSVIANPTAAVLNVNPIVTTTYTLTLLGTYCPISDQVVVTVNGTINLQHRQDTSVCPGTVVNLWATGIGVANNAWTWTPLNGGLISGCTNCSNPNVTVVASDAVIVTAVQSVTGCVAFDTIFIAQNPTPTSTFTVTTPVCQGSPSTITYTGTGLPTSIFNWNFAGGTPSGTGTGIGPHQVSWNAGGIYYPKLSVTDFGCTSLLDSQQVVVIPTLTSNFTRNAPNCVGNKLNLTYTGASGAYPGVIYTWKDGNNNVIGNTPNLSVTMTNPGKYKVSLQLSVGPTNLCPSVITYDSVTIYPNPIASFTTTPAAICTGTPILVTFNGTTNTGVAPNPTPTIPNYNWNWAGGVPTQVSNVPSYNTVWNTAPSAIAQTKTIVLIVSQDGCSDTISNNVVINPYPVAKINASSAITCAGVPIQFSSNGSSFINSASSVFNFTFPTTAPASATPASAVGVGPQSVTYNVTGSIQTVTAYLQITENGCISNKDSILVTVYPIPTGNFIFTPNPICAGGIVNYSYTGITNNAGGAITYNWTFNNGSPNKGSTAGPYNVKYNNTSAIQQHYITSLVVTQDGCSSVPFPGTVDVNPLPDPTIVGPADLCIDQSAYLTVTPSYVSYLWSTGATNDSIYVTGGTDVFVYVTDANTCSDSASFHITGHILPIANAGPDQTIFVGNSAHLDGSLSAGGNAYSWSPASTLDNPNIVDPNATPPSSQNYILTYYNAAFGCQDIDTVNITIRECDALRLPNAFAPNSNVPEDQTYHILNPGDFYRLVRMEIYNRWGQLVFATNDKNSKGWDGKFRGTDQEMGTYIYNVVAECGGGRVINLKGDVTLLR